jgi:hypothetical protein
MHRCPLSARQTSPSCHCLWVPHSDSDAVGAEPPFQKRLIVSCHLPCGDCCVLPSFVHCTEEGNLVSHEPVRWVERSPLRSRLLSTVPCPMGDRHTHLLWFLSRQRKNLGFLLLSDRWWTPRTRRSSQDLRQRSPLSTVREGAIILFLFEPTQHARDTLPSLAPPSDRIPPTPYFLATSVCFPALAFLPVGPSPVGSCVLERIR